MSHAHRQSKPGIPCQAKTRGSRRRVRTGGRKPGGSADHQGSDEREVMLAGSDLVSHLWENSHCLSDPPSASEHVASAPHFWQTERIRTRSPSWVISREKSGSSELKCGDMWRTSERSNSWRINPCFWLSFWYRRYSANPQGLAGSGDA